MATLMSALPPSLNSRKLGLAALVLLAPGGFLLGAGLAAKWWRDRARAAGDSADSSVGA